MNKEVYVSAKLDGKHSQWERNFILMIIRISNQVGGRLWINLFLKNLKIIGLSKNKRMAEMFSNLKSLSNKILVSELFYGDMWPT